MTATWILVALVLALTTALIVEHIRGDRARAACRRVDTVLAETLDRVAQIDTTPVRSQLPVRVPGTSWPRKRGAA